MRGVLRQFLVLFFSTSLTFAAEYNITVSETNTTAIQLSGNAADANICVVDSNGHLISGQAGCYNIPNNCTSNVAMGQSKDSAATFTFQGSAIYIHSLLFDESPLYNITLDGTSFNVDGVIPSDTFDCRTLYWKTGLDPNVEHTIRLGVAGQSPNAVNSSTSNSDIYTFSLINFVYTVDDSKPSSSVPIGPVVGGVVGGFFVILGAFIVLFYLRKRERTREPVEIDPDPKVVITNISHSPTTPALRSSSGPSVPIAGATATPPLSEAVVEHSEKNTHGRRPEIGHLSYLSPTPLEMPAISPPTPSSNVQTPVLRSSLAPSSPVTSTQPQGPSTNLLTNPTQLTEEEAQFLHNLYSLNVPATEIAAMMEVMRRNREAGTTNQAEGPSHGGLVSPEEGSMVSPPPAYDFKER